jgi:ribosomal protein L9
MAGKPIYAAMQVVQRELKAPKGQTNSFGGYKYRSCEDIVEAVKPLLNEQGLILTMSDDIVQVGDRIYVKATCRVIDVANGDNIETSALARESAQKKGMDDSQITGTASSYARKYALNGLFAIDDTKDADTDEYTKRQQAAQKSEQERKNAMHALNTAIKTVGVQNAEVSAIAGVKFGKTSTREMTTEEINRLAENLAGWIEEQEHD